MKQYLFNILSLYFIDITCAYYINTYIITPSDAKYGFNPILVQQDEIVNAEIEAWTPEDGTNVWEHTGLFEGDIMLYKTEQTVKNGLIDESAKWPFATVPYYIDDSFTEDEIISILNAMQEYHDKTCVRFRPYVQGDHCWIDIKQDWSGCWSSVGMKSEGQIVNLGSKKCRQHGVIVHELMHAVGFYHQQSASNRDEFIKIHWNNIKRGREHNFNKYNESVVTNYGVPYDYESVMHYSAKAFSRNGNITIEPINEHESLNIGQRNGLSEKDIQKINSMYHAECNNDSLNVIDVHLNMQQQQQEVAPYPIEGNYFDAIIKWFESIFGISLLNK